MTYIVSGGTLNSTQSLCAFGRSWEGFVCVCRARSGVWWSVSRLAQHDSCGTARILLSCVETALKTTDRRSSKMFTTYTLASCSFQSSSLWRSLSAFSPNPSTTNMWVIIKSNQFILPFFTSNCRHISCNGRSPEKHKSSTSWRPIINRTAVNILLCKNIQFNKKGKKRIKLTDKEFIQNLQIKRCNFSNSLNVLNEINGDGDWIYVRYLGSIVQIMRLLFYLRIKRFPLKDEK